MQAQHTIALTTALMGVCFTLCIEARGESPALRPNATELLKTLQPVPLSQDILVRPVVACSLIPSPATQSGQLWPDGANNNNIAEIPYQFAANVTVGNQQAMLASMADIEAVARISFIPRNGETAFIQIQDGDGNYSDSIGFNNNGVVNVVIFNWNFEFIMVHELIHVVGFNHEQQRPDRDGYVTINTRNIDPIYSRQFDIVPSARTVGPYDFDSVMHYKLNDGCIMVGMPPHCVGPTISVITPPLPNVPPANPAQTMIGQRERMSRFDKLGVSFNYFPPASWDWVDPTATQTGDGTFIHPWQDLATGFTMVPQGGTLWIKQGNYHYLGTIGANGQSVTLESVGPITIGQ